MTQGANGQRPHGRASPARLVNGCRRAEEWGHRQVDTVHSIVTAELLTFQTSAISHEWAASTSPIPLFRCPRCRLANAQTLLAATVAVLAAAATKNPAKSAENRCELA